MAVEAAVRENDSVVVLGSGVSLAPSRSGAINLEACRLERALVGGQSGGVY